MKREDARRLGSEGFSLAETLITVLLMSIVLVAITTGSSVALRSYQKITLEADARTLMATLSSSINSELRSADEVTLESGSTDNEVFSFHSRLRDAVLKYDQSTDGKIVLRGIKDDTVGGGVRVVADHTYGDKLSAEMTVLQFRKDPAPAGASSETPSTSEDTGKDDDGCFIYTLTVKSGGKIVDELENVMVRPLKCRVKQDTATS